MTKSQHLAPLLVALDRIQNIAEQATAAGQPNPPEFVTMATDTLKAAHKLLAGNHVADCLRLTSRLKALRLPLLGLDLLRAQIFLRMGQPDAAREALKEELRYFPDHIEARRLLESLTIPEQTLSSDLPPEFAQVLQKIRPYTMLSTARLRSLYNLAISVCREDLPGNMVECGVAAGGSSALLAWVIKRYSQRPRTLFCFDTFAGMPAPTEADTHAKTPANATGWGEGTCAAPMDSLIDICQQLEVDDIIHPVKGLFKDTLPTTSSQIGHIALLHMDGDWYESTRDILDNLYDQVVPQGRIQVDDYGHWEGCKKAIHEFEARRGIKFHMHPIDTTGVWFQKPSACTLQPRLLNLGCGQRYHPAWTNVDFTATGLDVLAHDLTQGIPFVDDTFDAVYHSHLLEHFAKDVAPMFLQECYRVLKPGGIIRVVVPDLENIARIYLMLLEKSLRGDSEAQKRYEWIMLELFDQMVRNYSGGAMLEYWRQNPMPAEDFVIARIGSEVKNVITQLRAQPKEPEPLASQPKRPCDPLAIGTFRLSGEVHQWMYDRYSLGKLLHEAGFEDIKVCRADESSIPQFNTFLLDIEADGSVRKPDSLFMEARKPRALKIEPSSTEKTTSQRPKIAQICAQDFGGAGTAALRLHDGLRLIGVNNSLYVHNIKRWRPGTVPLAFANTLLPPTNQKMISPGWDAFCAHNERGLAQYPNRPPHFEIFTDTWSAIRVSQIPEIAEADIINFHWIAGTVDVFKELDFLRTKKIVWTLHDMNPFTGGCHYAAGCSKYEQSCGSCPQLGSQDPDDLSRHIWTRKKAAYRQLDITIVALSQWLADCVKKSSLFSPFPVHVIPNGVPTDIFKPHPQAQIRESLHIPQDAFVVLFGADSLTNSRKGFAYLLQVLTQLASQAKNHALCLATFGQNGEAAVHHLGLPIFAFDYVENESELALIYSLADVTVLPSLEDNLPNIVLESLACGTPVVGFDVGGIPDMVTHLVNGYLAPVADAKGLVQGINWVMEQKQADSPIRIKCRETVLTRYNLLLQARSYQELYEEIMTQTIPSRQ